MASGTPTRTRGSRGSRLEDASEAELTSEARSLGGFTGGVAAWWAVRAAEAGLDGRWTDVRFALKARAASEISPRSEPPAGWHTPNDLGQAYLETLAAATRSEHGRHYTPPDLAEQLWRMTRRALGWPADDLQLPGLVVDPAAGGASLLIPPLREHLRASEGTDPAEVVRGLPGLMRGSDLDPVAVWVANVVLAAECLPLLAAIPTEARKPFPQLVYEADGLAPSASPALAVLMNPPYGRVRLTPDERLRFSHVVRGHANLYALFMAAGSAHLVEGGALGALVPTSFTAGRYFENLRGYLEASTPMREI
ncbi:hypothetical protein B7486_58830, partial [cyanobacterium TDX16]